jgi:hypothetical protein
LQEGLQQGLADLHDDKRFFVVLERRSPDQLFEAGRVAVRLALAPFLWDDKLGAMLDTTEVTERLGVTRQAVAKAVDAGRLIALPAGNTRHFPVWQFNFGDQTEIRPQVAQVVAAFREVYPDVRPLHIASWAMTSQPELEDTTPAAWLDSAGALEPLLQAAERAAWALEQ